MSFEEMIKKILERWDNRTLFMKRLIKLTAVCITRCLRLIIENPYSSESFLKTNFILPPSIIDKDRTTRGDSFRKPTAYWYINCEPTYGVSYTRPDKIKKVNNCKKGKEAGICSEERSMISKDYARNFICDFILGKKQPNSLPLLF
jgi:hypothetical protein